MIITRTSLPLALLVFLVSLNALTAPTAPLPGTEPTNAAEAAAKKEAEAAELDGKYQAWVATLTPEHQAWEKVLQENLGGFYLPIHKNEKVEGKVNAWDYVEDDPALPRVLIIGDSVSRGYTLAVRKVLKGKANVHRAPANCGPTKMGLEKLDVWLGQGKWDVIHFNFGIHDRATPLEDYRERLGKIVDRLSGTGAKLIWATTTPIPDVSETKQTSASIVERNAISAEIMKGKGVVINDLFAAITPHLATLQNPKDVHFNSDGYDFLGEKVGSAIEANLK